MIVVELDGAVDPLAVTPRSVSAWRDDGRPLSSQVATAGGRIVVRLDVDAGLLADPPAALRLRLLGLPSPQSLCTLDGRRLAGTVELEYPVARALEAAGPSPARLVALQGMPPRPGLVLDARGPLELSLEGVLDPDSLRPDSLPLFPLEQGLVLSSPAHAVPTWRCRGGEFEVRLDLSRLHGRFQLDLRRFAWRDLSGRIPEPALVAEVVAP